jgi:hypothetical protein
LKLRILLVLLAGGLPAWVFGAAPETEPPLSWWGYGELNYDRPADHPEEARFDLSRFVIGAGYRFDEHTRLQSELEIEHAVSSSSDPGEVEIEQAYIEHELHDGSFVRAGLFLIPSGLLNENHEPTRYHGVFRNFVETAIIPSTWREGGIGVQHDTAGGLKLQAGVTTGFDLSKWDAASSAGTDSPLGSIHQELAQARAVDFSGHLALNYTGAPGLKVGGSLFTGGAGQGQVGFTGARITLWEGHLRWEVRDLEVSALYARGRISGTAPINLRLLGGATLIPQGFYGAYLEAAWSGLAEYQLPLTPFLRYEQFNTAASYADLGPGLTPAAHPDRRPLTMGVDWLWTRGVILKADYVDFTDGGGGDRLALGLGYEF